MAKKILLVEDDKVLAQMYQDKLANNGFDLVGADTGSKALTILKSFVPDVILLDIMLPGGMNGFDILQILQIDQKLKKIPVIVLTNLAHGEKTKKALEYGANECLFKVNLTPKNLVQEALSLIPNSNIQSNHPNAV